MLAVVVAIASAACSVRGSEYQYVRNRPTGTYLRLPDSWKVAKVPGDEQLEFGRLFDGTEVDTNQQIMTSDRPAGFVQVRALSPSESDVISLELLRNVIYQIDAGVADGSVELVNYGRVDQGDFRGQHVVFRTFTEEGEATVAQVTMLDPKSTRFHLLVIGCLTKCYQEHEDQIDAVIESLTVKET